MDERLVEIRFGTVYKPLDRFNPKTNTVYPQYQKYVVTELMSEGVIASSWLDETGDVPRLAIGGTHPVAGIVELLSEMDIEQVLEAVEYGGWLDPTVEELFREEARKKPIKVKIG